MGSSSKRPLVSVITPTCNRVHLLRGALDSIYAQEGMGEQFDLEAIVVDDASTDHTLEVAQQYPTLRYIRLDRNGGTSAARNAGLKAVAGGYVGFLDDDDVWLPWKLGREVRLLESAPAVGLVYGQQVTRRGNEFCIWPEPQAAPSGWVVRPLLLRGTVNTCNVLVRRAALDHAGQFDESLRCWEDYDMWLRLASKWQFRFLPGPVAIYREAVSGRFLSAALSGESERDLRLIVDRAMDRLRANEHISPAFEREVQASVVMRIAGQFSALEQVEGLHDYLLRSLRELPWLARTPGLRYAVAQEARFSVQSSPAPLEATRSLCSEIRAAAGARGPRGWLAIRRLQAEVWRQVAARLATFTDERARLARYAAVRALALHPAALGRSLVKVLVGSFPRIG